MRTLETGDTLKKRNHEFVKGYLDAMYSQIPTPTIFNRRDYVKGYAVGSIDKDVLRGTLHPEIARQLRIVDCCCSR